MGACVAGAGVVVHADAQTGERWERTRAQVDAAVFVDTGRALDLALDQEVCRTGWVGCWPGQAYRIFCWPFAETGKHSRGHTFLSVHKLVMLSVTCTSFSHLQPSILEGRRR